jgi:DNA-binding transcriptional ArsR family regulator
MPDTVKGRILAELAADPFGTYTPSMLAELTETHSKTVSKVLQEIVALGLVRLKEVKGRQPFYEVNADRKSLYALIFLSLAVNDDLLGQNCMDRAIVEYVEKNLGCKVYRDARAFAAVAMISFDGSTEIVSTTAPIDPPVQRVGAIG